MASNDRRQGVAPYGRAAGRPGASRRRRPDVRRHIRLWDSMTRYIRDWEKLKNIVLYFDTQSCDLKDQNLN